MNTKEALFETAKKLMELQSEMVQRIAALRYDETVENAEVHLLTDNALNLCSKMFEVMKEDNKVFLNEMVEKGNYTYTNQYINGVEVEGKCYATKPVKGYELLNKEDSKVWAHVLKAAAEHCPEVIQKRITDSKVTVQFMEACCGLIAEKTTDDYTWSVTKVK